MKTTRHNPCSMMTLLALTLLLSLTTYTAHAQTYSVIHSFSGGADGATPHSGLTPDGAGNYYGTATYGGFQGQNCGQQGCGTVYKLAKKNGSWVLTNLYSFKGGNDGAWPTARVVFGPDGAIYGTTFSGSGNSCTNNGCGTIFRLTPPVNPCHAVSCPWTETILYTFHGPDGQLPAGEIIFDHAGNIYGTTVAGGSGEWGTVYKLTHANGHWTQSVLYNFTGQDDGGDPAAGVIFDRAGNLWGTTASGGWNSLPDFYGPGVIYELTPNGSAWNYTTIYKFTDNSSDGGLPVASLVLGSDGTMYGTTSSGGIGLCTYNTYYTGCGTVFSVAQSESPLFFNFPVPGENPGLSGPNAAITLDASANMYGTAYAAGHLGAGSVFEVTAFNRVYSSLHDFTGGSDGGYPSSNVTFDANGNMFGTTLSGGGSGICTMQGGCGVIWEIAH